MPKLSPKSPPLRILEFNGDLKTASVVAGGVEFAYQSTARALARVDRMPRRIEIDGAEWKPERFGDTLALPRGQHFVTLFE